jgi:hypothetical protein
LQWLLERVGGALAATHARPRLVLAEHPAGERFDAFWLVGGRVVDWGPLGAVDDVVERTARTLRGGDGTGATTCLAPDEVDEARIVATWLDGHDAHVLDLHSGADRTRVERFLVSAGAPLEPAGEAPAPRYGEAAGAAGAAAPWGAAPPPGTAAPRARAPRDQAVDPAAAPPGHAVPLPGLFAA